MKNITAIEELKSLLLSEDRAFVEDNFEKYKIELLSAIEAVEQEIVNPDKLSLHLAKNKIFIVDLLAPMVGKMIKSYLSLEIEKLNKRISSNKFTKGNYWKNLLFGWMNSGNNIEKLNHPEVLDIILIDKDSGLLLGKYSKEENADADVIAGMFNAIKSFADTAFSSEENELELIHYNDHKIKLKVLGSVYYAVIFSGRNTEEFQDLIEEDLNQFSNKYFDYIIHNQKQNDTTSELSELMNLEFSKTCKKLEEKLS